MMANIGPTHITPFEDRYIEEAERSAWAKSYVLLEERAKRRTAERMDSEDD